jgi:TatD DNase family protein
MPSKLFDIGANLTHESFNKDLKEVLERAIKNDINNICITGCNLSDSKKALEIATIIS